MHLKLHAPRVAAFSSQRVDVPSRATCACKAVKQHAELADVSHHPDRRLALLATASFALGNVAMTAQPAMAASAGVANAGDWTSPGLAAPEDPNLPKFYKTASGIKVQRLAEGTGPSPQPGDKVLIDYVLRRPNGYFIYSTVEGVSFQPRDVPVGPVAFVVGSDPEWIQGLQEVVLSMRQGGRLRALIPPSLGYQDCGKDQPQPPTFATKRQLQNHCKEPLLFELALLRVLQAGSA